MREGLKRGVVQPRAIVERVITQIDAFAVADDGQSQFMEPVKAIPAAITGKERVRVEDAYRAAVSGELIPAYRHLSQFLKSEYLPHAGHVPGLSAVPGGRELYLHLVKTETTSDLSPDQFMPPVYGS